VKSLARLLSATPYQAKGPVKMCIYDINALGLEFFFSDQVHVRVYTWIDNLIEQLQILQKETATRFAICFLDDQAQKRYKDYFPPEWEIIECQSIEGPGTPQRICYEFWPISANLCECKKKKI
jgi:hypothetical protein